MGKPEVHHHYDYTYYSPYSKFYSIHGVPYALHTDECVVKDECNRIGRTRYNMVKALMSLFCRFMLIISI